MFDSTQIKKKKKNTTKTKEKKNQYTIKQSQTSLLLLGSLLLEIKLKKKTINKILKKQKGCGEEKKNTHQETQRHIYSFPCSLLLYYNNHKKPHTHTHTKKTQTIPQFLFEFCVVLVLFFWCLKE